MQTEEAFDELGDFALLVARQLAGFLKHLAQAPGRSAARPLGGGFAEEQLHRHFEGRRKRGRGLLLTLGFQATPGFPPLQKSD